MNSRNAPGRIAPGRPLRIEIVDVLRGLAAVSVTWFHLTNTYEWNWLRASGSHGWLGVEVFFVISGFVIPYSIARSARIASAADFGRFMLRRMVRLEPPYIASIALVIALSWASSLAPGFRGAPFEAELGRIAAHFLYAVPLTDHPWLQPVYWTLAYEFCFYIACGLLFGILSDAERPWRWHLLAGALVALTFWGLPARSLLFVIGIAVFRRLVLGEGTVTMLAIIAASAAAITATQDLAIAATGTAAALAILLLSGVSLPRGRLFRAAIWLGSISYSLYLVHVPVGGRVVNLGNRFVDGPAQQLALSLVALAVSLAFAWAFWRIVERPSVRAAAQVGKASRTVSALP